MIKVPTILPDVFRGVGFVTGYRGIGKSFLAAQADFAPNIAFLNCDSDKGEGIKAQNNFGLFKSLTKDPKVLREGPLGLYDVLMDTIQNLEMDRYTVLVIDNIADIQLALDAEAVRNRSRYAKEYGLDPSKIARNAWGQQKAVSNFLISKVCNIIHSRGVRLVLVTTHIKPQWAGGQQVPNKWRVKGYDRWQTLSILTLILIPGDKPPVPSALVQKEQLGIIRSLNPDEMTPEQVDAIRRGEESGHQTMRRLPRRIPICTFQSLRRYLEHPADLSDPAEGEMPTFEESDPFDSKLSKEQFDFVRRAQLAQEIEQESHRAAVSQVSSSPKGGSMLLPATSPTPVQATDQVNEIRAKMSKLTGSRDEIQAELVKTYPLPLVLMAMTE